MPKINKILRDHVTLEVECIDRIYLNGYIPKMQVPGQLVNFLVDHRKQKIPSPVLLHQIKQKLVNDIKVYAQKMTFAQSILNLESAKMILLPECAKNIL